MVYLHDLEINFIQVGHTLTCYNVVQLLIVFLMYPAVMLA